MCVCSHAHIVAHTAHDVMRSHLSFTNVSTVPSYIYSYACMLYPYKSRSAVASYISLQQLAVCLI